jgi:threonine/homoserine/homoserine lactone efflux protein
LADVSELFGSLMTFALVATISPGGATTLATASGARFGFMRSMPLLAGIVIGLATLVGAAALGLGSITRALPQFELALRIVGSAYFLWLASTIGWQGAPGSKSAIGARPIGFIAGLFLLWANPKGWTMAISAALSFARVADRPIALASTLGAVFGLSAALSLSFWCTGGVWLSRTVHSEKGWRVLNTSLAVLLVVSIASMWR